MVVIGDGLTVRARDARAIRSDLRDLELEVYTSGRPGGYVALYVRRRGQQHLPWRTPTDLEAAQVGALPWERMRARGWGGVR